MPQPLLHLGGDGPLLHLAVANGFPPATYLPLLRPLFEAYRVICLPPRALWPDEQPPAELREWDSLADDLLAGMQQHALDPVIAVGHSFGGIASVLAAMREPARFRALCLLDPTFLLPEWLAGLEQLRSSGSVMQDFPLAQMALRRRRTFESAEAAFSNFRGKTAFRNWPDETLRLYAEHGTRPAANGQGVELAWSAEWEAYYYCTPYARLWSVLPQLSPTIPLLIVRGATSDTLLPQAVEMLRGVLPHMHTVEIDGHGHLFPQSAPKETASIIQAWLRDVFPES
ncbi:MAG: alpha/beta hydrolase [Anaerolineae bacterium]|nr:alpha/beta hydrolase [Anaerolineae bacterium]